MTSAEIMFRSVRVCNTSSVDAPMAEIEPAIDDLLAIVNGLFPIECDYQTRFIKDPDERARTALDNLIGTNKTRMGALPGDEARQAMEAQVRKAVVGRKPIQLVTVWGTSRDPQHPEANDAELADFSAFMMLQAAVERIKAVHPQGALVRVYEENVACEWLDVQNPNDPAEVQRVRDYMDRYFRTKARMLHVLTHSTEGGLPIEIVYESDLLRKMGYSREQFLADCEVLKPLFNAYLIDSNKVMTEYLRDTPYASWDEFRQSASPELYQSEWQQCDALLRTLESFHALARHGWKGTIPPQMRGFYLDKNKRLFPEIADNPEALFDAVAKYFASTLRKATLGSVFFGLAFPETAIKIPLVKLANERPAEFERQVPLRSITHDTKRKVHPECVAPWLGQGYYHEGKIGIARYGGLPQGEVVPVQLTLSSDPAPCGSSKISYPIGAKVVLK